MNEQPEVAFREAPLVRLISTDLTKLSPVELEQPIASLREMRSSPQTARAKTDQRTRKKDTFAFDPGSML